MARSTTLLDSLTSYGATPRYRLAPQSRYSQGQRLRSCRLVRSCSTARSLSSVPSAFLARSGHVVHTAFLARSVLMVHSSAMARSKDMAHATFLARSSLTARSSVDGSLTSLGTLEGCDSFPMIGALHQRDSLLSLWPRSTRTARSFDVAPSSSTARALTLLVRLQPTRLRSAAMARSGSIGSLYQYGTL
jgi:hypothetical protein